MRMVFETYTRRHLSVNAIARLLNEQRIPTRTEKTRWERSTVWAMLRKRAHWLTYQTILHAESPRSECSVHGVRVVKLPWAEPSSRFTALFEALGH